METIKHTPAPWGLIHNSGSSFNIYGNNEENLIAKIIPCFGEEKANAQLIAAAPEMLEALKALCKLVDDAGHSLWTTHAEAHGAIAKAEGK